ncbi:hypothetical protein KAJ83_15680 [Marivibrio halodurans]|uniref:Uncharacterized protein n=1 Tax=Marivibrio halodurans TaxID=2039722 RepID=A0A8J7V3N8_9PROT|nr:hypothetical protein [Marivibrio halodurans]MBP5858461.1 hypothetical protein [Marivibrio halodurans]
MPHPRYSPRSIDCAGSETPFACAEEAWFWAIDSHDNRMAGARNRAGRAAIIRPCEARDILNAAARLYRSRRIGREHLDVMFRFARLHRPPDPRVEEETEAADLWDAGLREVDDILRAKGFIQS